MISRALIGLALSLALAPAGARAQAPEPRIRRWYVHVNAGINLYTFNAPTQSAPPQHITPATRVNLGQQIGLGYYVLPNLRLQLTVQFGESVSGLPAGASPLTMVAILPLVVFIVRGGFVGVGPLIAPRAWGRDEVELGVFLAGGYGFKLPHNFGIAAAVQLPVTILNRVSIQITPLVSASYRF